MTGVQTCALPIYTTASLISIMRLPNPLHLALIFSSLTLDSPTKEAGEVGVTLHPNGITGKCLDVQGGVLKNGTPVQMYIFLFFPRTTSLADHLLCAALTATIRAPRSGWLTIAKSNFDSQIQTFAWTQRRVVRIFDTYPASITDN